MFADGSKLPYERTRRLIQKLAGPLKATPLRLSIIGHTSAGFVPARGEYGAFDLSADRANVVRQILEREGLPQSHIFAVSGKADSQPLFPDDPTLPANRRVTITLMREDPPLPPDLKPITVGIPNTASRTVSPLSPVGRSLWCYDHAGRLTGTAEASIAARINSTVRAFLLRHDRQRHIHRSP